LTVLVIVSSFDRDFVDLVDGLMLVDYVRLSYGPRMDVLKAGLDAIQRVVQK
jgi:hypothetical protein